MMQIILGKEIADELRERYTVLELETLTVGGKKITAFCVVGTESVPLSEMSELDRLCRLHQTFIDAFNAQRYDAALDAVQHITGKFSGTLDSFYTEICQKIKDANVATNN